MLIPQVLCPRGIYEAPFYVMTIGTLVLFSVTSQGVRHRKRVVRSQEQYDRAWRELTDALDADDPLPDLSLVE